MAVAAAALHANALAFPSSPTSLLLSRSRSPTPAAFGSDLASSPASSMRWRLVLGVGAPAVAALAASVPPAVLRDGGATLLITASAYSLVRTFDALTDRRLIEQAEFEQKDCACAIRGSVHVFLATVQVFPATASRVQTQNVYHNQIRLEILSNTCSICSDSTEARFFAAVVPFLNCIRLLIYGLRLYTDEALVKSVTREGKPE